MTTINTFTPSAQKRISNAVRSVEASPINLMGKSNRRPTGGNIVETISYLYKIQNKSRTVDDNYKCLIGFEGGSVNIQGLNIDLPIYKNDAETGANPEEIESIEITEEGTYKAYLAYNYDFAETAPKSECFLEISGVDEQILSHRHYLIGSFIAENDSSGVLRIKDITHFHLESSGVFGHTFNSILYDISDMDASDCKIKRLTTNVRIGGVEKNTEDSEHIIDKDLMYIYTPLTLATGNFTIGTTSIAEQIPAMTGAVTNAKLGVISSCISSGKRRITNISSYSVDWRSSLWS